MLRELEVEERVRKYLKEHGFTMKEGTGKKGVDIRAVKDSENYYIEVEGNAKPDGTVLRNRYTHLFRAVGQICWRMGDNPEGVFCLALPEDEYYRKKINKLKVPLRKLGVRTYFVDSNGRVVEQ